MKPYYDDGQVVIYHGDCREVREWLSADVLVTDPPYGMSYVSSWTTRRPVTGDRDASARDDALEMWGDKPALVFGTWRVARPDNTRHVLIWHKESIGPGMGDLTLPWGNATEEIYVIGSGWRGARRSNLLATSEQRGNPYGAAALLGHPTPKSVRLMGMLVECAPDGIIADPFMGVGATLLAARNLGRRAIGIEIEERYCQIAAQRLSQETLGLDVPT